MACSGVSATFSFHPRTATLPDFCINACDKLIAANG